MTDKRYYYTDPLAAAWMAKHFGMRFVTQHAYSEMCFRKYRINSFKWQIGNSNYAGDIFYIHPDSLHLLEPILCDRIQYEGKAKITRYVMNKEDKEAQFTGIVDGEKRWFMGYDHTIDPESAKSSVDAGHAKIIQRNGVAFMWPEVEEAT